VWNVWEIAMSLTTEGVSLLALKSADDLRTAGSPFMLRWPLWSSEANYLQRRRPLFNIFKRGSRFNFVYSLVAPRLAKG
jgi:hypothetical protein